MTHTFRRCNIDIETILAIHLYTCIVTSICSFIGNLLVILTVYKNKNLRTSINYFIVSMSVSDILFPLVRLLADMFTKGSFSRSSELSGNLLSKLLLFLFSVSYGVSMLTLVAIAVYRFSAVMFPLRARVQNKRKRILVLVLTWVIPIVMSSLHLVYSEFIVRHPFCLRGLSNKQLRSWIIADVSLFFFLPLLNMLVLYPLIIIKLTQQRVPGNVASLPMVIKRKRQNLRLTMMCIVLTVAFLLCWGPLIIWTLIYRVLGRSNTHIHSCIVTYLFLVSFLTPVVFHAINPVIYFIFLSSFRQGFKDIFRSFCCNNRTRPQAPADNFKQNNIPPALHHD